MLFADLFKFSAFSLAPNGKITIDDEFKKEVEGKSCVCPILRYYFTICTEVLQNNENPRIRKAGEPVEFRQSEAPFFELTYSITRNTTVDF
jgi:hypothetical protein